MKSRYRRLLRIANLGQQFDRDHRMPRARQENVPLNHAPSRDLDQNWLWDDHDFALSTAICIWANYFVVPTMTRAEALLDLSRDDCNVLIALWFYDSLTASDICFLLGRPRNSISRAVNRLLKRELIASVPNGEDGRKSDLSMTATGRQVMNQLISIFVERQHLMLSRLGKRQQETLHKLLSQTLQDTARWAEHLPMIA